MSPTIKFCCSCNEAFSKRFVYCPNCATKLDLYEMAPVSSTQAEQPLVLSQTNQSTERVGLDNKPDPSTTLEAPQTFHLREEANPGSFPEHRSKYPEIVGGVGKLNPNAVETDEGIEGNKNRNAVILCAAIAFAVHLVFSKSLPAAFGGAIGSLVIPGIVALIASRRSKNWRWAFVPAWALLFVLSLVGTYAVTD